MVIPFHRAFLDDNEINSVAEVLRSGWITMGEKTFEFEKKFASYVGASHAVAVNSCTSALHLALKAIDLQPGDEVIIPAITFIATWEVITYFGAVPVLADVEKDTHLLDVDSFLKSITPKTRAVIPVHYSGQPCDMDPIMEIARSKNIWVIEDAAHSLPAYYNGRAVGTIGDITCFSFYATKTITTGEGGMLTTDNPQIADRVKRLRLHGISRDAWNRYSSAGSWKYDVEEAGYKYNPTDISSAIGIEQLKKSSEMNKMREEIASKYNSCFAENDLVEIYPIREGRISSWHLYPLKIKVENLTINRDIFIEEMKAQGISTSVHFIPLYRFSCLKGSGYLPEDFPSSEFIFNREVSIPIYPGLENKEVDYVLDTSINILEKYKK